MRKPKPSRKSKQRAFTLGHALSFLFWFGMGVAVNYVAGPNWTLAMVGGLVAMVGAEIRYGTKKP